MTANDSDVSKPSSSVNLSCIVNDIAQWEFILDDVERNHDRIVAAILRNQSRSLRHHKHTRDLLRFASNQNRLRYTSWKVAITRYIYFSIGDLLQSKSSPLLTRFIRLSTHSLPWKSLYFPAKPHPQLYILCLNWLECLSLPDLTSEQATSSSLDDEALSSSFEHVSKSIGRQRICLSYTDPFPHFRRIDATYLDGQPLVAIAFSNGSVDIMKLPTDHTPSNLQDLVTLDPPYAGEENDNAYSKLFPIAFLAFIDSSHILVGHFAGNIDLWNIDWQNSTSFPARLMSRIFPFSSDPMSGQLLLTGYYDANSKILVLSSLPESSEYPITTEPHFRFGLTCLRASLSAPYLKTESSSQTESDGINQEGFLHIYQNLLNWACSKATNALTYYTGRCSSKAVESDAAFRLDIRPLPDGNEFDCEALLATLGCYGSCSVWKLPHLTPLFIFVGSPSPTGGDPFPFDIAWWSVSDRVAQSADLAVLYSNGHLVSMSSAPLGDRLQSISSIDIQLDPFARLTATSNGLIVYSTSTSDQQQPIIDSTSQFKIQHIASTTPFGLFTHCLRQGAFDDALELARQHQFDVELVHKQIWLMASHQPDLEIDQLLYSTLALVKGQSRWVIRQCLSFIPSPIDVNHQHFLDQIAKTLNYASDRLTKEDDDSKWTRSAQRELVQFQRYLHVLTTESSSLGQLTTSQLADFIVRLRLFGPCNVALYYSFKGQFELVAFLARQFPREVGQHRLVMISLLPQTFNPHSYVGLLEPSSFCSADFSTIDDDIAQPTWLNDWHFTVLDSKDQLSDVVGQWTNDTCEAIDELTGLTEYASILLDTVVKQFNLPTVSSSEKIRNQLFSNQVLFKQLMLLVSQSDLVAKCISDQPNNHHRAPFTRPIELTISSLAKIDVDRRFAMLLDAFFLSSARSDNRLVDFFSTFVTPQLALFELNGFDNSSSQRLLVQLFTYVANQMQGFLDHADLVEMLTNRNNQSVSEVLDFVPLGNSSEAFNSVYGQLIVSSLIDTVKSYKHRGETDSYLPSCVILLEACGRYCSPLQPLVNSSNSAMIQSQQQEIDDLLRFATHLQHLNKVMSGQPSIGDFLTIATNPKRLVVYLHQSIGYFLLPTRRASASASCDSDADDSLGHQINQFYSILSSAFESFPSHANLSPAFHFALLASGSEYLIRLSCNMSVSLAENRSRQWQASLLSALQSYSDACLPQPPSWLMSSSNTVSSSGPEQMARHCIEVLKKCTLLDSILAERVNVEERLLDASGFLLFVNSHQTQSLGQLTPLCLRKWWTSDDGTFQLHRQQLLNRTLQLILLSGRSTVVPFHAVKTNLAQLASCFLLSTSLAEQCLLEVVRDCLLAHKSALSTQIASFCLEVLQRQLSCPKDDSSTWLTCARWAGVSGDDLDLHEHEWLQLASFLLGNSALGQEAFHFQRRLLLAALAGCPPVKLPQLVSCWLSSLQSSQSALSKQADDNTSKHRLVQFKIPPFYHPLTTRPIFSPIQTRGDHSSQAVTRFDRHQPCNDPDCPCLVRHLFQLLSSLPRSTDKEYALSTWFRTIMCLANNCSYTALHFVRSPFSRRMLFLKLIAEENLTKLSAEINSLCLPTSPSLSEFDRRFRLIVCLTCHFILTNKSLNDSSLLSLPLSGFNTASDDVVTHIKHALTACLESHLSLLSIDSNLSDPRDVIHRVSRTHLSLGLKLAMLLDVGDKTLVCNVVCDRIAHLCSSSLGSSPPAELPQLINGLLNSPPLTDRFLHLASTTIYDGLADWFSIRRFFHAFPIKSDPEWPLIGRLSIKLHKKVVSLIDDDPNVFGLLDQIGGYQRLLLQLMTDKHESDTSSSFINFLAKPTCFQLTSNIVRMLREHQVRAISQGRLALLNHVTIMIRQRGCDTDPSVSQQVLAEICDAEHSTPNDSVKRLTIWLNRLLVGDDSTVITHPSLRQLILSQLDSFVDRKMSESVSSSSQVERECWIKLQHLVRLYQKRESAVRSLSTSLHFPSPTILTRVLCVNPTNKEAVACIIESVAQTVWDSLGSITEHRPIIPTSPLGVDRRRAAVGLVWALSLTEPLLDLFVPCVDTKLDLIVKCIDVFTSSTSQPDMCAFSSCFDDNQTTTSDRLFSSILVTFLTRWSADDRDITTRLVARLLLASRPGSCYDRSLLLARLVSNKVVESGQTLVYSGMSLVASTIDSLRDCLTCFVDKLVRSSPLLPCLTECVEQCLAASLANEVDDQLTDIEAVHRLIDFTLLVCSSFDLSTPEWTVNLWTLLLDHIHNHLESIDASRLISLFFLPTDSPSPDLSRACLAFLRRQPGNSPTHSLTLSICLASPGKDFVECDLLPYLLSQPASSSQLSSVDSDSCSLFLTRHLDQLIQPQLTGQSAVERRHLLSQLLYPLLDCGSSKQVGNDHRRRFLLHLLDRLESTGQFWVERFRIVEAIDDSGRQRPTRHESMSRLVRRCQSRRD